MSLHKCPTYVDQTSHDEEAGIHVSFIKQIFQTKMFGLENLSMKTTGIPTYIVRCLANICPGIYDGHFSGFHLSSVLDQQFCHMTMSCQFDLLNSAETICPVFRLTDTPLILGVAADIPVFLKQKIVCSDRQARFIRAHFLNL